MKIFSGLLAIALLGLSAQANSAIVNFNVATVYQLCFAGSLPMCPLYAEGTGTGTASLNTDTGEFTMNETRDVFGQGPGPNPPPDPNNQEGTSVATFEYEIDGVLTGNSLAYDPMDTLFVATSCETTSGDATVCLLLPVNMPSEWSGAPNPLVFDLAIGGTTMWNSNPGSETFVMYTLTTVPVPAAVWLFGSALGLLGWVRRRK